MPAPSINVKLRLPAVHCIDSTEGITELEGADELYMRVSTGLGVPQRIPSEDGYYKAPSGWHLQDHGWEGHDIPPDMRPPTLWRGSLADGQEVTIDITFHDQDVGVLGHQLIGGFAVVIRNSGGQPALRWAAGEKTSIAHDAGFGPHGPAAECCYFNLRGAGSYNAIARVTLE